MKILKKIKLYIENNSSYVTVVSTILLTILTIFSSFYSSNIQNKIQKSATAPIFFLEEDENDTIKIINKGGMISYFNFKRVTEIYISVNNKKIGLDIYYYDKNRLYNTSSNIDKKTSWSYIPVLKGIEEEEIRSLVNNKIEEIFPEEINTFVEIKDYYVLSCEDYENNHKKFYYIINNEGVGEPYDYVEKNFEEENFIASGGISSYSYSSVENFYNQLENVIANELLQFRWYSGDINET